MSLHRYTDTALLCHQLLAADGHWSQLRHSSTYNSNDDNYTVVN